jgi:hypothetical protein
VSPAAIAYPFGAVDERVTRAAIACGYSLGFGLGGRWTGDPMRVPREAVHCWSPSLPVVGPFGCVERAVSRIACRCSVGTILWQRLTNRSSVIPSGAPNARRRGIAMTVSFRAEARRAGGEESRSSRPVPSEARDREGLAPRSGRSRFLASAASRLRSE